MWYFLVNFLCLAAVKSVCSLWWTGLWWWEFYFHEISIISTWLRLPIWCADLFRCNVRFDVKWKKSNVIVNETVKRAIFYSKNVYFVTIFVVVIAGFMGVVKNLLVERQWKLMFLKHLLPRIFIMLLTPHIFLMLLIPDSKPHRAFLSQISSIISLHLF